MEFDWNISGRTADYFYRTSTSHTVPTSVSWRHRETRDTVTLLEYAPFPADLLSLRPLFVNSRFPLMLRTPARGSYMT
jgi:hypothetical protein